ncbi:zona pellucida-binding protein 2 isoform X2 [Ascaphus truei]|uniref:zona pellucida-binding protein 2 isoform X2 n=1 Tax=Ascaphus truei TaxID=8439 RepID=UPI003F59F460
MDVDIALKETIDPYYIWLGPDGRNLKGHSNANITETGKLALKSFEKSMSGPYSCTLSFSSIKNNIREEKEKFKSYAFLVLAYREPDYMYQINVRFTAKPCDTAANGHFYDKLLDLVEGLVSGLTCHLTNKFYKCHVIKAPQHTLQSELFVTFRVNPFGRGWESICRGISYDCEDDSNKRVQKARDRIQEFFIEQPRVLREDFVNVPDIHYIPHSLEITRSDSCRPGFGKNEVTHHDCSGCCGNTGFISQAQRRLGNPPHV